MSSTQDFRDSVQNPTSTVASSGDGIVRRLNSTATEYIGHEVTSDVALTTIAEIFKMVKMGVEDPNVVKMEILNSEIRIRVDNITVLSAKKPNGVDSWTLMADHQIRKAVNPGWTKFFFKQP